jgi:IPTL-CTERM motif
LDLVSGPEVCPSSLDGQLSANTSVSEAGLEVSGGIDGGETLGFSTFSGMVVGDPTASGTFTTTNGPFSGFDGTWSATLGGIVVAVPTLETAGLVLLAVLLALASAVVLRRRSRAFAR